MIIFFYKRHYSFGSFYVRVDMTRLFISRFVRTFYLAKEKRRLVLDTALISVNFQEFSYIIHPKERFPEKRTNTHTLHSHGKLSCDFAYFFSLHSRIVQFLRFTRSAQLGHIVREDLKNIRATSWKCSKFKSEL